MRNFIRELTYWSPLGFIFVPLFVLGTKTKSSVWIHFNGAVQALYLVGIFLLLCYFKIG
jgi:hypothetical protein